MTGNNGNGGGEGVSWVECGYFKAVSWSDRGGCEHVNEFMWCAGCPEHHAAEKITERKGGSDVNKGGR